MFRLTPADRAARRHRRKLARVPRDLSPRLMRDIGLDPWPEEPHIPPLPRW